MEKTTIYIPEDMQRGLRQAAKREGKPQSVLIRRALEEYLEKAGRPGLRSLGAGEDSGLAARDAEGWLESEWGGR
ncbi:MAG: ribbon-helix-helix domain-containing protein [Rubrobacteraceae bacterium]